MEEQKRLTMEFVKSLMDKSYTLVWVGYNDNFDNCYDTIQKCLEERSCESLWEKVDEWYDDAEWEAVHEIFSKLKDECIGFHGFEEEEVEEFFEEHEEEILLHQAAKNAFDEMGVKKLPKVKDLQAEYSKPLEEKKKTYAEYRRSREEMRELLTAKANVDRVLNMDEEQKKEQEKDHGQR